MRIIAGAHRGRRIDAPAGLVTRPTIDRVRESLFSSLTSLLGPELGGGAALDAFAGSGALGLEALSRGVARVTFVERDRRALEALRRNLSALGEEGAAEVRHGDVSVLARRGLGGPFALILLDPPYTLDAARVTALLETLAGVGDIGQGATVTWEHAGDSAVQWPDGFEPVQAKRYGTSAIDIARYVRGEGGT